MSEGISPAGLLQRFALFAVWILCHGHFGHVGNNQVDNGKSAYDQQNETQPEMPYNCDHGIQLYRGMASWLEQQTMVFNVFEANYGRILWNHPPRSDFCDWFKIFNKHCFGEYVNRV
jgi:hypothetical protein